MHVLVVDDDEASRYLIQSILQSVGHRVTHVADGEQALESARRDRPDVVVSDILMPRMDGYQLCRALKADSELADIPIAFCTATYADAADERFALGFGADAFWRKPVEPNDLIRRVEQLGAADTPGACQPSCTDETAVLEQYDARLIEKLEEKAEGLERANQELTHAMDLLGGEIALKERLIEELRADAADRERVAAELRQERDFSRQVLEVAELFFCILDHELRITLFSAGAERITGFRAQQIVGEDAVGLLVAEEARTTAREAVKAVECGQVDKRVIDVRTASGDMRSLDCSIACTRMDGSEASYNILGVDVTERRALEELKGDFIQTVSHELRTPLTSIVGFTDLLAQLRNDRLVEQAPVIADRLRENADRMRTLVEELLEVNDIAARGVALARRPVDLAEVVRRSAQAVFRTPNHPLSIHAASDMPLVDCDSERMGRVVTNLVSNAVKYSPEGGRIEVHVTTAGHEALITVADEGAGISDEDLERLFGRFTQADMSSTRLFGGVGLGLYIVSEIVRAHGGWVTVQSAPDIGSSFQVHLPMTRE